MSVPVSLQELAGELDRRWNAAYLLTVSETGRAHCVAVALEWQGEELAMRVGTTSARNARASGHATLLSPPVPPARIVGIGDGADADGVGGAGDDSVGASHDAYSLIVDVDVSATNLETGDGASTVRVRPTHAVLHRPAFKPRSDREGGCVHDCVPVLDQALPQS